MTACLMTISRTPTLQRHLLITLGFPARNEGEKEEVRQAPSLVPSHVCKLPLSTFLARSLFVSAAADEGMN